MDEAKKPRKSELEAAHRFKDLMSDFIYSAEEFLTAKQLPDELYDGLERIIWTTELLSNAVLEKNYGLRLNTKGSGDGGGSEKA